MNSNRLDSNFSRLFAEISGDEAETMIKCIGGYTKNYRKNSFVSFMGEPVHSIGVVLQGTVHMIQEDLWGDKTILAVIKKGELIGETFACGSSNVSTVTFAAAEKCTILFLPFDKVMHTCGNACLFHQKLIMNLLGMIADKNRQLMEKTEIISRPILREKIIAYLSFYAHKEGSREFNIDLGRTELAEYLCANRSAVARELSNMKKEGIIDFDKNFFRIL